MGSGGATRTSYVQLRDGSGGDSVGKNGLTPEKKGGGVKRHWYSRGVVEGMLSCG